MDPIELLTGTAIFEGMTPAELEPLRPATRVRTFERGSHLFREGDPGTHLCVVVHGQVKIGRVNEGGGEVVYGIAGPGEVFGELSLFDEEGERTADAQALEATECILIAKAPLLAFFTAQPSLLLRIIASLSGYIKRKDATMRDVAFLDIPGRIAMKLIELAETKGRAAADGTEIDLPLNQGTLAAMVGASRENVNRALRRFSDLGYIRLDRGTITVLNRDELRRRGSSHV
jgi:CRP/FNR family transcriptional regulator/CRP/FNR family cyclic AMP-dependent transcriptional regulator